MDFRLSSDQEALRGLARRIFTELGGHDRLKEVAAEGMDRRLWTELGKAGLPGLWLPSERGGSGQGFLEACIVLVEQGRAVAPVPLWPTALAAAALERSGGHEDLVARAAAGEVVLSVALQEPTGRQGTKTLVPYAEDAEAVVVSSDDRLLLVSDATLERQQTSSGQPSFEMTFGDGQPLDVPVGWVAERATVALCALAVGVAERALQMTAEYLSQREQFGRPLGTFQAVQQRAADAYIDVEAMRWTTFQAAWDLGHERDATDAVRVAKFWASEGGGRVLAAAQHLHGGIGVDLDYPLHRYTLWAKEIELTLGSATPQLAAIGAALARGEVR